MSNKNKNKNKNITATSQCADSCKNEIKNGKDLVTSSNSTKDESWVKGLVLYIGDLFISNEEESSSRAFDDKTPRNNLPPSTTKEAPSSTASEGVGAVGKHNHQQLDEEQRFKKEKRESTTEEGDLDCDFRDAASLNSPSGGGIEWVLSEKQDDEAECNACDDVQAHVHNNNGSSRSLRSIFSRRRRKKKKSKEGKGRD
mmetsp:Transcript_23826/g.50176  ORF Transcript_23826/g.50176 Transcript_23826/m.50176 type:complete len:199 (+) Transcript_23826:196-792(+)